MHAYLLSSRESSANARDCHNLWAKDSDQGFFGRMFGSSPHATSEPGLLCHVLAVPLRKSCRKKRS